MKFFFFIRDLIDAEAPELIETGPKGRKEPSLARRETRGEGDRRVAVAVRRDDIDRDESSGTRNTLDSLDRFVLPELVLRDRRLPRVGWRRVE